MNDDCLFPGGRSIPSRPPNLVGCYQGDFVGFGGLVGLGALVGLGGLGDFVALGGLVASGGCGVDTVDTWTVTCGIVTVGTSTVG